MRRKLPKPIEKPPYEPVGARCGSCPYTALGGREPVKPRTNSNSRFLVVLDQPDPASVRHGELRTTASQRLLEKSLAESGATDVNYLYAAACRRPEGAKDKDVAEAIRACKPRLEAEIEQANPQGGGDELRWLLTLGNASFQSVTGKSGSADAWLGSPVAAELAGTKVIPSWDPYYIGTPKGSRYAAVFTTHIDRYVKLTTGQLPPFQWGEEVVDSGPGMLSALQRILDAARTGQKVAVDIETNGKGTDSKITCVGLAIRGLSACAQYPFLPEEQELFFEILRVAHTVMQNGRSFDSKVLTKHGFKLEGPWDDTLLAASILDPQLPRNLGFLVNSEFHAEAHKAEFKTDQETGVLEGIWDSTDPAIQRERRIYCGRDAVTTELVWGVQEERLSRYGRRYYEGLKERDTIGQEMTDTGVPWSFRGAAELVEKYGAMQEKAREQLVRAVTLFGIQNFNPGSPDQVAALFFSKMRVVPSVYTPEGKPSTSVDALIEILKADNPAAREVARKVLEYRKAQKLLSTYAVGMAPPPGQKRIYGRWRMDTTPTERASCTEVPLQTLGAEPRKLIEEEDGRLICEADLAGAELRTVMLLAGASEMVKVLNDGGDLYSIISTEMFGKTVSKKENSKLRQLGKLVILASNYTASEETVWRQVIKKDIDPGKSDKKVWEEFPDLGVKQVGALIRGYFRKVPQIPDWQKRETEASGKRGYYFCPWDEGKLFFYGPPDAGLATNYPNQRGVAFVMNRAFVGANKERQPGDVWLTYVHDALAMSFWEGQEERVKNLLHKHMECVLEYGGLKAVMPVESKVGKTLYDVK